MAVRSPISLLGGIATLLCIVNCNLLSLHDPIVYRCSIGICHSYHRQSNLCNSFYESTDYIFTTYTMNQLLLSTVLDERILPLLSGDEGECGDLISRVLCHYFFAPCGANGQLRLPLSVCPDECHYVQTVCVKQWRIANHLLSAAGLSNISCSATGSLLQGLAPCCTDTGIEIKGKYSLKFMLNDLLYIMQHDL